jgi:hypothetical protein
MIGRTRRKIQEFLLVEAGGQRSKLSAISDQLSAQTKAHN